MEEKKTTCGWNRPQGSLQSPNGRSKNGGASKSFKHGVVALLTIVILGGLAFWLFMGDRQTEGDGEAEATRSTIKEVKPNLPPKRTVVKDTKPVATAVVTKAEAPVAPEVKSRKAPSTAKKYPRRVIPRRPEPPQKFKYDSDDLIGAFLEIAPGDQVEGGLRFDKIGRDFEKSLLEDVALAEGQDNEYNKQLREMVRETKKEIQQVMKEEGKTFGQVMQEQFDQLIELGQYKRNLEEQLREIRKSGEYTPDEYKKFIEASNAMLRGKGCSELKVPKATFYQVELYRQRRAAKEAMGLEKETKESKAAAKAAMMNNGDNENE